MNPKNLEDSFALKIFAFLMVNTVRLVFSRQKTDLVTEPKLVLLAARQASNWEMSCWGKE